MLIHPHPADLTFHVDPAQTVMSHDWVASPDRTLSIETALDLVQALYPKFFNLEYSEPMLALDRLDPSLSTLCLLLDTHRLCLSAHDSGSAYI